jgi:uncharacterized protein (DUF2141 family)
MIYPRVNAPKRYRMRAIAFAATALYSAAVPTLAHTRGSADLNIEASGFNDESGHAIAKLFLPGQNVRQRGQLEIKADIRGGKASLAFPALPPGEYAVVVFHDANDNGVIDHKLIGIPSEELGFSNAFKLSFSSGLPTFEKLRFAHGESAQTIAIHVEAL